MFCLEDSVKLSGLTWPKLINFSSLSRRRTLSLDGSALKADWKKLFSKEYLREDVMAGLVVACAALPLSLALALASGVSPATGIVTAIVAGLVCALFGGSPLSVSGPANTMTVLISTLVARQGVGALLVVTGIAGLFQLLTGAFKLGRLIKYIPSPVVTGFTAGIGAIILAGQLPRALGLPAPDPAHICDFWTHAGEMFRQFQMASLGVAVLTLLIMYFVPKRWPKVPAAMVAVIIPSLLVIVLGLKLDVIGQIPNQLPLPTMPIFPKTGFWDLIVAAFTVYAIASMETLLSCSAVDKLSKGKPHDPDQELIGQGLGNIASSIFGGIPATSVIARSGLNIQAGAKTRRAAIFHSLFLVATVYFLSPVIGRIPIAVLAGILLSVALRMLSLKEIRSLWSSSKGDALVYIATFLTILSVGLLAGVEVGIIASLLIAVLRLSQLQITSHSHDRRTPFRVTLVGPLTFLASSKLEALKNQVVEGEEKQILIDLSRVTVVDSSGAEQLSALVQLLLQKECRVVLLSPSENCRKLLEKQDKEITSLFATSESEAQSRLGGNSAVCRLFHGLNIYSNSRSKYDSLFQRLSNGQSPHTLLLTCSDSRIDPGLITSTYPGELFIVRNVGNLVPKFDSNQTGGEQAALEYSLSVLNVRELIVCGHSGCGAVQAIINGIPTGLPGVTKWLTMSMGDNLLNADNVDDAAKSNVLSQIENLMTYSIVRKKVAEGSLRIHGWFYQIKTGDVLVWDADSSEFRNVTANNGTCATK